MKGSDLIQLKVNSLTVHGASYPVVSSVAESKGGSEGKSTAKKTIGGAGLGAIIGGIAGNLSLNSQALTKRSIRPFIISDPMTSPKARIGNKKASVVRLNRKEAMTHGK